MSEELQETKEKPILGGMLEDNSGGTSSMRVFMFIWGGGVFLIWAFVAILGALNKQFTLPVIPTEVVTLIIGILGCKTVQRFGEK